MTLKTFLSARIVVPLLLAACAAAFFYWNSPERRIRAVLSEGRRAVESEDLERAMSQVSLQYRDDYGLTFLSLKRVAKRAFQEFEGMDIELSVVKTHVEDDRAVVLAKIDVYAGGPQGPEYLMGNPDAQHPAKITLIKEVLRWKIKNIEGIRPPFSDF